MPRHKSGSVLAFIGDGVITLKVREYLVDRGYTKSKDLQEKSIVFVSAKGQAEFMETLLQKDFLSEDEMNIYKRGRNANMGSIAKNVSVVTYRVASGFEALIGYLYYVDKDRMTIILDLMIEHFKERV